MELPSELKQALERLQAGVVESSDVETLRRALQAGQIVLATGERAVAIGGNADSTIILTVELHIALNAHQCTDLQRLPAARRYTPPLPAHDIPGEKYVGSLRRALLDDGAAALGIVGVRGMGGIPRPSTTWLTNKTI